MRFRFLSLLAFPLLLIFASCEKRNFTEDSSAKLSFSSNEIFFDTLFKGIGSATQRFKVYNPNSQPVKISTVQLEGGSSSPYSLNIDGRPANSVSGYELNGKDSMFIFAELKIDQSKPSNPYIVKDSIKFLTNGNRQFLRLKGYGQQAKFYNDTAVTSNETWQSSNTYVIVDQMLVDEDVTLSIQEGTEIYGTGGALIFIAGTMQAQGTKEDPIVFQGHRPEDSYNNVPGQWQGLHFLPTSKNNFLSYTTITEGIVGIRVDSFSTQGDTIPKVQLNNVHIKNMTNYGILGFSTNILATNTIVSESCGSLVSGIYGGNYQFFHCTFANNGCKCSSDDPGLFFTNRVLEDPDAGPISFDLNVVLENSIAWGNDEEEFILANEGPKDVNASVSHNLLKTSNQNYNTNGNILNKRPQFKQPCSNDFALENNSPALNAGNNIESLIDNLGLPLEQDFENNERDATQPEIGAVEHEQ